MLSLNSTTLLALVTLASVSPLLTFAKLWQVKEWRIDRLREHLRAEGWLRQLFGIVRPAILGGSIVLGMLNVPYWEHSALAMMAALGGMQLALKRQPIPVWTQKARVLTATSLLITLITATFIIHNSQFTILTPLLQPAFLLLAWTLFLPVDASLKARIMQRAKALRAAHPELHVVGITGSVGKTTTKELLAHILADQNPLVTPAYVNSEMGVSNWLIQTLSPQPPTTSPQPLVIEMGAYRKGEIEKLCSIAAPEIGIITFIGSQHISLFGSQEALCKAKAELLDALPEHGHAFLNADNEHCEELRTHCACTVTTVGTGDANLEAFDIEETIDGVRFSLGTDTVTVPLHGTHNVTNILLAIATAEHLGMERQRILERLKTYAPPSHTFSVRTEEHVTILDDTHNASPESFKAAIAWARTQPREQKILITPGLIELGTEEERIHHELGALAESTFDRVIFTHKHNADAFAKGFATGVEFMQKDTEPIQHDALLVCVGNMSQRTIDKLLPPK